MPSARTARRAGLLAALAALSVGCSGLAGGLDIPDGVPAFDVHNDTSGSVTVALCADRHCSAVDSFRPRLPPGGSSTFAINPNTNVSITVIRGGLGGTRTCIPVGDSLCSDPSIYQVSSAIPCANVPTGHRD